MAILRFIIICIMLLFLRNNIYILIPSIQSDTPKQPIKQPIKSIDIETIKTNDDTSKTEINNLHKTFYWSDIELSTMQLDSQEHPIDLLDPNPPRPTINDLLKPDPFQDSIITNIGDTLLLPPELILDQLVACIGLFRDRSGDHVLDTENKSVLSRIFDVSAQPSRDHLFSTMIYNVVKKEQKFFARFEDSYLNTPGFDEGTEDIDQSALISEQRKVLWDVAKDTYISKYKFKIDDKIRDEAFYFSDWQNADFIVLPPLVAGYLWYRGLEKKYKFAGTELHLSVEPINNIYYNDNELFGVGVEWAPEDWAIKLIVAGGIEDGDPELQFIGIGTNFGIAKKAYNLQRE